MRYESVELQDIPKVEHAPRAGPATAPYAGPIEGWGVAPMFQTRAGIPSKTVEGILDDLGFTRIRPRMRCHLQTPTSQAQMRPRKAAASGQSDHPCRGGGRPNPDFRAGIPVAARG